MLWLHIPEASAIFVWCRVGSAVKSICGWVDDMQRVLVRSWVSRETTDVVITIGPLCVDDARSQRCKDLIRTNDRTRNISSPEALILLRASFSVPRVLHLLRCSPSKNHPALLAFLASAVSKHLVSSGLDPRRYQSTLIVISYRHTYRPGLAHLLINFIRIQHSGIAPSSYLTVPTFGPALTVLFNWLPFQLLQPIIAGCILRPQT